MFNDHGRIIRKFQVGDEFHILEPERVMPIPDWYKFIYEGKFNPILIMDTNETIGEIRNDYILYCHAMPAGYRWNGKEFRKD